ncbi:hypothetical protein TNCV_958511 [Trichonephila clavipes]|nr:hypothetical protein TNCV_958511 [Trichonephila clavipes]
MKRIVTGDETWCHHYEPETKRDSMQWKHASSPPPKKFRAVKGSKQGVAHCLFRRSRSTTYGIPRAQKKH